MGIHIILWLGDLFHNHSLSIPFMGYGDEELGNDITVICPKSDLPEDNLANYEYINLEFKQFNIFSRIKIMFLFFKNIKE
jgi:hypothetical protein